MSKVSKAINESAHEIDLASVIKITDLPHIFNQDDLDTASQIELKKYVETLSEKGIKEPTSTLKYKKFFEDLRKQKEQKDLRHLIEEIGVETVVLLAYWYRKIAEAHLQEATLRDDAK